MAPEKRDPGPCDSGTQGNETLTPRTPEMGP